MSRNKDVERQSPIYRAVIAGCGSFAPEKILTNDDLAKMIDTTDEWITTRTGIKRRHIAADNESTACLATEAAKRALADAKLDPKELDVIIVATITPEMVFPSTACFVQLNLGATNAFAFDIAAACSGFIYSIAISQEFIEKGRFKNILVIGAETLTKITNYKDRTSCILFGDAAGAVVLQRSRDTQKGVLYTTMYSDPNYWEALNCRAYGSLYPADKKLDDPNKIYMEIHGREVYQQAVRRIVEAVNECLDKCNLTIDDIAMVISHQMNARIIESASKRLGATKEKMFININEYGNTSAASVPLVLGSVLKTSKIAADAVKIAG
ncbi:unnamed protein product [marine sediment metagenome]|uniref:Beta-ketoacyl-[acyl-carrier-protein] synthase III N-terminal domain-containing protein n=1 Tax=marine sediment metagenome TaxID=412755 RepID=X1LIF0_9ZZZZ